MRHMMKTAILASVCSAALAQAAMAEKWDMPLAYPASNYHTENVVEFAACVKEATGGEIDIVAHPNGSLFGGADIKRAVQTGQVPIGERLLSAHANENPLFGVDSIPFLATSFEESGNHGMRQARLSPRRWTSRISSSSTPCRGRRRASISRRK
ncbi:hypothetical protein V6L77_04265 [Pannonibacter sp. Pt2-lr]